jgi:UDP-arabinose 4-epimerase
MSPQDGRGGTENRVKLTHAKDPTMNAVLVTGGAGYIGSHAAKALALAGHLPVCYDNLSRGHRWAVQWGPLAQGDLRDQAVLRKALREHAIQAVMHFAAFAYVGESMLQPSMYFDNNCGGTVSLLEAMRLERVNQLIFSSTCATYGYPDSLPIAESAPQRPVNPYGESKLFAEKAIRWHAECHGLRYIILRYFNAAGSDPDLEIGELHVPETHLIPLMIEAALDPSRQVEIFGTDYPTPDGTAVRDYVHVTDLASAHVLALEHLTHKPGCIDMNLGTGIGCSVIGVLDAVARVTGRHPAARLTSRRPGDPAILVADPRKAQNTLDWKPSYSSLESIVTTAWEWRKSATRLAKAS